MSFVPKTYLRTKDGRILAEILPGAPPVDVDRLLAEAELRPATVWRPAGSNGAIRQPPLLGLGDWVETWAKPIARWIDVRLPASSLLEWVVDRFVAAGWVTLPLAGCSACSRRRAWLNQLVPDLRSPRAWQGAPRRLYRAIYTALQGSGTGLAKQPPKA